MASMVPSPHDPNGLRPARAVVASQSGGLSLTRLVSESHRFHACEDQRQRTEREWHAIGDQVWHLVVDQLLCNVADDGGMLWSGLHTRLLRLVSRLKFVEVLHSRVTSSC